ncbi:MAG: MFS transporter [Firmicutes bacterium]|nr:MFS transporter [Bacillota bacterium]
MSTVSHVADASSVVTVRSLAKKSPFLFLVIVIVSAIPAFLEGFDANLYGFASPFIVHQVHGTAAFLGTIATGYALGIALFSLVGGYLFDKFSVKYTIMLSVAIFTVFTVITGFVTTPSLLWASRFMVGVGTGIFQPAIIALLGDIFFATRGRAVSAFAVFFGLGLFLSPYLINPFLPHYQIPFVISGVAGVLSLLLVAIVIPRTYKNKEPYSLKIGKFFDRNVIVLSLSIFLFGIALFGFLSYDSDYLLNGLSLPSSKAAEIYSMGGLGGLICAFPLGYLADKFGRKPIVTLASLLIMIGSVGMFLVSKSPAALFILTFSFGAGWGIYVDLVASLGQDSVNDSIAGTVTGWLFFVFNIGAMLGGPLFAAMLPHGFVIAGLVTMGGASILSFILTLLTRKVVSRSDLIA